MERAETAVNKDAGREGPRKKRWVRAGPQGDQGNSGASHAIEGHGDNKGGLSGLQTYPSPAHPSCRRLDTLEELAPENIVPDAKASKFPRLLCFPIP
ncbi:hypothetical protein Tco_0038539 [Tanacetum coccineum]